ncbi:MAG TPA: endonuclease III [Desulfatiglandales bacterium]|nr:endonuclease III [Desulfatiglandales bacterium]
MNNIDNKDRVIQIITILEEEYPDARTALSFDTPLELLVSTVLSAQCTDERVNKVTRELFKKYRSAKDYARVDLPELEDDIRPTGFFRNKAKSIKAFCAVLDEQYNGEVPASLEELVSLPGIGRKTANLVLSEVFDIPGIVVDTHVLRLSKLIGLTKNSDATKVEFDLMEFIPKEKWRLFSNLLILHGRAVCIARRPRHQACQIVNLCDAGVGWKNENPA